MIIYDNTGQSYRLTNKLAEGGEGEIYQLENHPDVLCKRYRQPSGELEQKILHLSQLRALPGSTSVALPLSPVYTKTGTPQQTSFTGFLMPNIHDGACLFSYLSPRERACQFPDITMLHLYTIAHNLAAQVETIHQWGNTVIGDLNFLNVLVLPDMRVAIVDFDSVQYTNGRVYPCKVGMPEFTPPEGFGANGAISQAHDLFALAVLIFQLLRMGDYPFRAKMILPIEKPQVGLFLKDKGIYPYVANKVAGPAGNAMPYAWLEPEIRAAFNRTFSDGSKNPDRRVTASDWRKILHQCVQRLQTCPNHPKYQYGYHLSSCPWCDSSK